MKSNYVLVPNVVGIVLGSAQLIVYMIYKKKPSSSVIEDKGSDQIVKEGIKMQDLIMMMKLKQKNMGSSKEEMYIPNKRGRSTRSRLGFIRYDCSVAADMAMSKAHGLWCDDKALKVKMAEFRKEYENKQSKAPPLQQGWDKEGNQHEYYWKSSKLFVNVIIPAACLYH
ncbi:unnamed protein product [Camellia sinensis]